MMLYVLLSLACASPQTQEPPSPEHSTKSETMPIRLTLDSPADLPDLQRQLNTTAERQHFLIELGPGPFKNTTLIFGSQTDSTPRHDLQVVGKSTLLENSSLLAIGETVSISGIRSIGAPASGPPLRAHATEEIALSDVHLSKLSARVRNSGSQSRGGAAELRALKDGVVAHLNHVTLYESAQAISFTAKPRGRFSDIQLTSMRIHATPSPAVTTGPAAWIHVGNVQQTEQQEGWLSVSNPTTLVEGEAKVSPPSESLLAAWATGEW